MFTTYEEYLKTANYLTFEQMQYIHRQMNEQIQNDADGLELYDEIVNAANRYAQIRAEWCLLDKEEKIKRDEGRTSAHDTLIIKFNQLARYLKMQGKNTSWREELGDLEKDPSMRKRIGDFACYIVFINSINAR